MARQLFAAAAALWLVAALHLQEAGAQTANQRPAVPNQVTMVALVRSAVLAVHHANETGNYTVLRDLGAPGFHAANTAARLSEIFAPLRAQGVELIAAAVADPQWTTPPQIESNGMLRVAGTFPGAAQQLAFDFLFAPADGRWRVFGVSLNLVPAAAATAQPEPAPATGQPRPANPPVRPPTRP